MPKNKGTLEYVNKFLVKDGLQAKHQQTEQIPYTGQAPKGVPVHKEKMRLTD